MPVLRPRDRAVTRRSTSVRRCWPSHGPADSVSGPHGPRHGRREAHRDGHRHPRHPGQRSDSAGDRPPPSGRRPRDGARALRLRAGWIGRPALAHGVRPAVRLALGAERDASAERRRHPQRVGRRPHRRALRERHPDTDRHRHAGAADGGAHPARVDDGPADPHADLGRHPDRHTHDRAHRDTDSDPDPDAVPDHVRPGADSGGRRHRHPGVGVVAARRRGRRGDRRRGPRTALASPRGVGGRPRVDRRRGDVVRA